MGHIELACAVSDFHHKSVSIVVKPASVIADLACSVVGDSQKRAFYASIRSCQTLVDQSNQICQLLGLTRLTTVRIASLALSVTSTIILGLQTLNAWTGVAFALVAVVTTVNALEPFFAWRDRWVLMGETQYRFYRLRDELTYYIAATKPDQLDEGKLREVFDEYQRIWDQLGTRWLEYRRAAGSDG